MKSTKSTRVQGGLGMVLGAERIILSNVSWFQRFNQVFILEESINLVRIKFRHLEMDLSFLLLVCGTLEREL